MAPHLIPFLYFGAVIIFAVGVTGFSWRQMRRIHGLPLTPIEAFSLPAAQVEPGATVQLRLSWTGHTAVIFAVVLGTIGAGVTYLTLRAIAADARFAKEALTATADVLGGWKQGKPERVVQYQFRIDGHTYQGRGHLPDSSALANALRSKKIEVRYLPSAPAINQPVDSAHLPAALLLVVPLALDVPACVLIWYLRRNYRLARDGRLTHGKVVAVILQQFGSLTAHYDFRNDQGGVTRGSSTLRFPAALDIFVGSTVEVLYLPDNPEVNRIRDAMLWKTTDARYVMV